MGFIIFVHVTVCILLVITVLMQAGRGGGLTETFQSAENMFGTQTNVLMVRLTSIFAVIFLCTSLLLAFESSKVNQSLMVNKKLLATVPKPVAPAAKPEADNVSVKVEEPKPMTAPASDESKDVAATPVTNASK